MYKQLISMVYLVLLSVTTAGHAAVHKNYNEYAAATGNIMIFNGHISDTGVIRQHNDLAQSNTPEFVLTEEDIRSVQKALNELGYDAGNIDGLAHIRTVKAIVELQQKEGLPVTGEIDQQLLEFLDLQ